MEKTLNSNFSSGNFWQFLTRPHERITDIEERRQSQLLAGVLLAIIGSSIVGQLLLLVANNPFDWFLVIAILVVFGFYLINRRGYYRIAATLAVFNHFFIIHFGAVQTGSISWLFFASTAVLLSAIFLSFRMSLMVVVASLVAQLILNTVSPSREEFGNAAPAIIFIFTSSLVLVFMQHRIMLERERQAELLEANRRLRESEIALEQRVEARTAELAISKQETELALEKALEADQLKSQFLASMSHELRTPLNAILAFTELLQMGTFGEVSEEQKDYLGKVFFSGKHLLSLINDVLDISKIQSGMLKLFYEDDFDIQKEMSIIEDTAKNLLADKPVELILEIDSQLEPLRCDKRRLRQILLNLMSNAVKFTQKGTITLCAKQQDGEVLFAVIDTGPGIAAGVQEIIFEPFVQTEMGVQHVGGTGLGLPISKKLAEAHGGTIWLESNLGEGTAFYVKIPTAQKTETN